jgi:GT2 family glycosyltransferase
LRAADGDYLVLLNNDTYVTGGWLYGLIRHLLADETLGLIGPVTDNIGNEAKIDLPAEGLAERLELARHYIDEHRGQRLMTDNLGFFCVAFGRSVLESVGYLDERFAVGYFEDDDYCRRVREQGFGIAIAEDVFVHHRLSASFDQLGPERLAVFQRNKALFEEKWGAWRPHRQRPAVASEARKR